MARGTLKRWNSDRGFGFIQSETKGSPDVFLHSRDLPQGIRCTQPGDLILYTLEPGKEGKPRAIQATIEGVYPKTVPHQASKKLAASKPVKRSLSTGFKDAKSIVGGLASIVTVGYGVVLIIRLLSPSASPESPTAPVSQPPPILNSFNPNCNIKGNISQSSGKKYYHLPGMEDYEITQIDEGFGERWFCTEQEAIDAGWTKAPN